MSIDPTDYPAHLEIDHADHYSRLLIFVKWLLAIPHYIAIYVLGFGAALGLFIAWFAVLFTGRYPEALFDFIVGVERWRLRVGAYILLQVDTYPPFTLADVPSYPVRVQVRRPEHIARWRPLLNWLLAIPALIISAVISVIAAIAVFIAFLAILITGRYPDDLFNVVRIGLRWQLRVTIFAFFMTGDYPPIIWG